MLFRSAEAESVVVAASPDAAGSEVSNRIARVRQMMLIVVFIIDAAIIDCQMPPSRARSDRIVSVSLRTDGRPRSTHERERCDAFM